MIMCFNGLGTIVQALISVLIINPENEKPSIPVQSGRVVYNYYGEDVIQQVPQFFRIFALAQVILLIFSLAVIWIPPYELEREDEIRMPWNVEQDNHVKLRIALGSRQFYMSYIMMFCGVLYFQYISIVFKSFGEYHGLDDQYLTLSATAGMVMNCLSRMLGGIILDKLRFKFYFGFILTLSVVLSFTYS